jgi:hypothetical protein
MRRLLFGLILTFASALPAAAQLKGDPPTLPATDITAKDIQAFLKALPANEISDLPIRAVDVGGYKVGVLVTGGVITDTKAPPQGRNAGPRGDKIEGGVSRRVSAGDMIIIPGRTPHWWSSLESDIHYLIIRPDPDGRMRLK